MNDDILPAGLNAPMTPEELGILVSELGGLEAVASKIHRAPITILTWLRGRHAVPPLIAICLRVSACAASAPPEQAEQFRAEEEAVYAFIKLKPRRRRSADSVPAPPPQPPSPPSRPRKPRRMRSSEVKRCVALLGGVRATAEAIGCAPSLIPHYQYGKRVMPDGLAERLQQAVELKRSAP